MSTIGKYIETESRLVLPRARVWEAGMMAKGYRVSFRGDENVLK